MAYQLLASGQDPFRAVEIGEASLYALLGFGVVFVGILFLIFIVWVTGKIIPAFEGGKKQQNEESRKEVSKTEENPVVNETQASTAVETSEIDEETVAIITAAIMAYYQKNNPKCEFTVRRIKKI